MPDSISIKPGEDEVIVDPKAMVKDRRVCRDALVVFTRYMSRAVDELTIDHRDTGIFRDRGYIGKYRGRDILVLKPCFGAPASIFLFELAIAAGAERFIFLGEAGAIHSDLAITDYVVPDWGVREEGTSYHYRPADYKPIINTPLLKRLLDVLATFPHGYRVHRGGVWSIDAPFRETRDKINRYREMGVLCVEMEATAFMTVADYRGVDLAILLVISDELYGEEWRTGWETRELEEAEYKAVEVGLEALL
jgi:uridine phosphorylase